MRTLNSVALVGAGLIAGVVLGHIIRFGSAVESPPGGERALTLAANAPEVDRDIRVATSMEEALDGPGDFQRCLRVTQYVAGLSAAGLAGAANEALHLPLQRRDEVLMLIYLRWSELDPQAAVQHAQSLPRTRALTGLRRAVVAAWAERDGAAALAWAKAAKSDDERTEAMSAVLGVIARRDPRAALQALLEDSPNRQAGAVIGEIFGTWAEGDLPGALAAAQALANADLRDSALQAALKRQIEVEPRAALEAIRELKIDNRAVELVWPAFERWMERDGEGARAFVARLPAGRLRADSLYVVATAMARTRPLEALAWASGLADAQDRALTTARLFEVWPTNDTAGAFAAAKALPDDAVRSAALLSRLDRITDADLPMAVAMAGELLSGDQRKTAYGKLAGKWARNDPQGAAEWIVKNAPDVDLANLKGVLAAWGKTAPEKVRGWVAALPSGAAREEASGILIAQLAQSDPAAAAVELSKAMPEAQRKAAATMARTLASKAPADAARWAASLPDPGAQTIALVEVARAWAQNNPADTAQWLNTLAPGQGKDAAIATFSRTALRRDPEGAIAWVDVISHPAGRDQLMCSLVTDWLALDRAASTAWLENNVSLDPQLKNRILVIDDFLRKSRP